MTNMKAIKDLVIHSYYGTSPDPSQFSNKDVKATLSNEIHKLANDYRSFMRNRNDIFEIMEQAYNEILPKQVEDFIGVFAEVQHVGDNEKAIFKVKQGRDRAKQFVTLAAISGVYEMFRLDSTQFELGGQVIAGGAWIDYERYICGDEDIAESTQLLLDGLQLAVYGQIQRALLAAVNAEDRPANNRFIGAGFDADAMSKLCATASNYSPNGGVVIYATREFIMEMGPDAIGRPVYGNVNQNISGGGYGGYATPVYNPQNIQEIAQYGKIRTFRGNPIVEIPQSFTDETNTTTYMNPSTAYIFPISETKPVKVVFEGDLQLRDWVDRDRNFEIDIYQKVGVAILTHYDWCVYVNMNLADPDKYPTKYQLDLTSTSATGVADGTYNP